MQLAGKLLLSAFILFNMLVWAWRHTPAWWDRIYWGKVDQHLAPEQAAAVRSVPAALNWYAHKVGLDNKWEMYSSLYRGDWTIIAVGIDANGKQVLLPEPLQTPRTWFESAVVDFREPKYQIHLTRWPDQAERYTRYLLRRYPSHNGVPIRDVVLNLRFRPYVESTYVAARTGSHFAGVEWETRFYPPISPVSSASASGESQ